MPSSKLSTKLRKPRHEYTILDLPDDALTKIFQLYIQSTNREDEELELRVNYKMIRDTVTPSSIFSALLGERVMSVLTMCKRFALLSNRLITALSLDAIPPTQLYDCTPNVSCDHIARSVSIYLDMYAPKIRDVQLPYIPNEKQLTRILNEQLNYSVIRQLRFCHTPNLELSAKLVSSPCLKRLIVSMPTPAFLEHLSRGFPSLADLELYDVEYSLLCPLLRCLELRSTISTADDRGCLESINIVCREHVPNDNNVQQMVTVYQEELWLEAFVRDLDEKAGVIFEHLRFFAFRAPGFDTCMKRVSTYIEDTMAHRGELIFGPDTIVDFGFVDNKPRPSNFVTNPNDTLQNTVQAQPNQFPQNVTSDYSTLLGRETINLANLFGINNERRADALKQYSHSTTLLLESHYAVNQFHELVPVMKDYVIDFIADVSAHGRLKRIELPFRINGRYAKANNEMKDRIWQFLTLILPRAPSIMHLEVSSELLEPIDGMRRSVESIVDGMQHIRSLYFRRCDHLYKSFRSRVGLERNDLLLMSNPLGGLWNFLAYAAAKCPNLDEIILETTNNLIKASQTRYPESWNYSDMKHRMKEYESASHRVDISSIKHLVQKLQKAH